MSINAQANSIDELFSSNVHYRVPHYQRRYVWDETNWDRLWKDILFQIDGEVEGEDHPTHFTGPIVTRSIGKKAYEVIDGQQRLATFQIILCVIRDLCKTRPQDDTQQSKLASAAAKYIINDEDVLIDDPDYQFTFVPTFYDQPAFREVTSEKYLQNRENSDEHCILKAYNYFADRIQEHVGENLDYEKMRRLLRSITDNFVLVKLELGGEDERPEQVFASINATGRKLSEFDYLRNDLFLRAGNLEIDQKRGEHYSDGFYRDYWVFENDSQYWGEDTLESFFRAFLMAKLGPDCFSVKNAKPFELYWEYSKTLTDEQDIKYEFQQLKNYAEFYKEMNDPAMETYRLQFHEDLNLIFDNLNLTSLHPFMLFIKNESDLSDSELTQVFTMLESYIVRGLLDNGVNENKNICKRINNFFSNLIPNRSNKGSANREFKVEEFAEFLFQKGKHGEGRRWQHDGAVLHGLRCVGKQIRHGGPRVEIPAWNMLGYILYRIELWKIERWNQENLSETKKKVTFHLKDFLRRTKDDDRESVIQTKSALGVQHIMPPLRHYKLEDSFSIGNLVFCTEHLTNQLPFPDKKRILSEGDNADIILNKEICKEYENNYTWGVEQIRRRERMLRQCFNKIWPPPEHFIGQVTKPEVEPKTKPSGDTSESKTKPKVEPRWVSMLQSDNYQPAMFVTYTKSIELSRIQQSGNTTIGVDRANEKQTLEKPNILFACSSVSWQEVEPYIETLDSVKKEGLSHPPQTKEERLRLQDRFLQSARDKKDSVVPVTRDGHMLEGTIEDFDEDAIYMQIRECTVIVYRHGLYEFGVQHWHQGVVEEFDESRGFGYIRSSDYSRRVFVHITEIPDRTINSLQPNQKVEFDINYTTKGNGLSAINVEVIDE